MTHVPSRQKAILRIEENHKKRVSDIIPERMEH
jgi:hypothetical protein